MAGSRQALIIVSALSGLFHQFSCYSLLLPVEDRGRFLIVFTFFKFSDNAFFLYQAFEAFNSFFEYFVIIYDDMSQMNSPPPGLI